MVSVYGNRTCCSLSAIVATVAGPPPRRIRADLPAPASVIVGWRSGQRATVWVAGVVMLDLLSTVGLGWGLGNLRLSTKTSTASWFVVSLAGGRSCTLATARRSVGGHSCGRDPDTNGGAGPRDVPGALPNGRLTYRPHRSVGSARPSRSACAGRGCGARTPLLARGWPPLWCPREGGCAPRPEWRAC